MHVLVLTMFISNFRPYNISHRLSNPTAVWYKPLLLAIHDVDWCLQLLWCPLYRARIHLLIWRHFSPVLSGVCLQSTHLSADLTPLFTCSQWCLFTEHAFICCSDPTFHLFSVVSLYRARIHLLTWCHSSAVLSGVCLRSMHSSAFQMHLGKFSQCVW